MTSDYPDWTDLIHLVGTDIMLAIDIQGAYIMTPVDIQAQYLTLEIDIKAQSIEAIKVDITTQTLESINVDITAQTIGDILIDIDAQSIGIYLQPDWMVREGAQKYLNGTLIAVSSGSGGNAVYYALAAGRTFWVYFISASCSNGGEVTGTVRGKLSDDAGGLGHIAKKDGFFCPYTIPVRIDGGGGGNHVILGLFNQGDAVMDLNGTVGGYEADTPA